MKTHRICGLVLLGLLLAGSLEAQETIPREYSADEFVSFDRSLSMKTALDILSTFSQRNEGKIIIDPAGHSKPIGVMVNNMYWKRALEYILRSNLLSYVEREKYYEVVPLSQTKPAQQAGPQVDHYTHEVEINAIFFEADYQSVLEAGIDWSFIQDGKVRVNGNFGSEVGRDLFSVQYTDSFRMWDIFALLRVFEASNRGEIIANPTIKVMEGEQGKIKVGTNFFLTTRDFAGNTRFTEYEAGVILTVTPHVIGKEDSLFIHLNIDAERSSVTPDPLNVTKAITESKTQVLLVNGEETVIAGLFSNETTEVRRGIPILKDLPPWFFGLRYLFGYNAKEFSKKELVILLEARVVPTVAQRLDMRLGQRDYLEEKRLQFQRKLRQLKNNPGSGSNNHTSSSRNNVSNYDGAGGRLYYGVEVGTFPDRQEALSASQTYRTRGYQVGLVQNSANEYAVLVGAYTSETEARRLADYFRRRDGISPRVVRYRN